jgi:hypothetical protein
MPVQRCQKDGKPGFKWGQDGTCYTYSNNAERDKAAAKAARQGRAIEASKGKRGK